MPDPFEAARSKNRILVALVVLVIVWALPYVIDQLMYKFTGHGIFTEPPDIADVSLGKTTLGDAIKTLITWMQWMVTGVVAVILVVNILKLATAE